MKKTILLMLVVSSILAAQSTSSKTNFELRNDAKQIQLKNISVSLNPDEGFTKKSGFMAVLYSLLLPGMGELYAGNYDRGKYFTVADGVFWGAYAGFNIYGNWQRNSYKSFAATYGGVEINGKDAGYFANISEFTNIDDYNRRKGLDGDFDQLYDVQKYNWKWKDVAQRTEYRNMWESSEQAFNNVRFAVGALILNRIISAIDAALLVRSYNKQLNIQTGWNVSVGNNSVYPSGMEINFQTSF
ncbi:MAG: hypothetical protein NTX22_14065 [Ignavibacteriales bacterium]|nr:hypothetical protein [Ignavibacteriales bacterium]